MSAHESDREDLMCEAVALVRRAEFTTPAETDPVVCGCRANGSLSVYFGDDPVYHFDPDARLRRAFVEGLLYRTQGTTLARLRRERRPGVTELLRHDLDAGELEAFLTEMRTRLRQLLLALESNIAKLVAQVPPEDSIVPDLIDALTRVLNVDKPLAPAIKGKR